MATASKNFDAATEEGEYDLREDVLEMIAHSSLRDFDDQPLAWANWCRRMAVAALNDDIDSVCRMVSVGPGARGET